MSEHGTKYSGFMCDTRYTSCTEHPKKGGNQSACFMLERVCVCARACVRAGWVGGRGGAQLRGRISHLDQVINGEIVAEMAEEPISRVESTPKATAVWASRCRLRRIARSTVCTMKPPRPCRVRKTGRLQRHKRCTPNNTHTLSMHKTVNMVGWKRRLLWSLERFDVRVEPSRGRWCG
jgi:hypothetical protein